MLALTLKDGEALTIHHGGEHARLRVVRRPDGKTKILFDGPKSFGFVRNAAKHKRTGEPDRNPAA